jgi:radical SAM protein with 4Fe4S-binding SPASM domain
VRLGTSAEPIVKGLRVFADGTEQYPAWFERFGLAMSRGVKTGIVYTVTAQHLGLEERIYNFFRNLLGAYPGCSGVRFGPVYPTGRAGEEDGGSLLVSDEQYAGFLEAMGRLWSAAAVPCDMEPFRSGAGAEPHGCAFLPDCGRHFLAVDGQGRVSPCGRFLDSGIFIGSLPADDLQTLERNLRALLPGDRTARLGQGECRGCPHLERCNGGCPYLARLYHGEVNRKDPFCAAHRTLFATSRTRVMVAR